MATLTVTSHTLRELRTLCDERKFDELQQVEIATATDDGYSDVTTIEDEVWAAGGDEWFWISRTKEKLRRGTTACYNIRWDEEIETYIISDDGPATI